MSKKLLIISPAFHGYCHSIADGFRGLGYEVTVHRYDAFDTVKDKVRNKALYELPSKLGFDGQKAAEKAATSKALEVIEQVKPDKLIVIKADTLGDNFWQAVSDRKVPYLLWLYDDLKRHRYTFEFLRSLPAVVSYARSEAESFAAEGINAHFVANGYDPKLAAFPTTRVPEIVFVGSRYENRETILLALKDAGLSVRAYGRGWSHHPFDRLRTWELKRPNLPAERDIPLHEAYRVQAAAAASLNVHGLQAGLAMRTFEVPGMNGLQLIDRPDVAEFYEIGKEVLLYQSTEELIELCQHIIADPRWSDSIRAAGLKRSQAEHTFFHRAQSMDALWV
ncbi:glycosyltransferase [Rothia sp. (in: high G+C Gram-positive bacteria)]|uniref:CgeB family protein n=1 Tax=unclassified Rothia (in: high G+C Gram-positive bacteria) TaxID=2689056 RepID=UPI0032165D72